MTYSRDRKEEEELRGINGTPASFTELFDRSDTKTNVKYIGEVPEPKSAENDSKADPGRDDKGQFSGGAAMSLQPSYGDAPHLDDPQTFNVEPVKPTVSTGNPNTSKHPKMDYPESVNPLSITNEEGETE